MFASTLNGRHIRIIDKMLLPPTMNQLALHAHQFGALQGGRNTWGESKRPLCSRHFRRADTEAPVLGCMEVETHAPGKGWVVSPPPPRAVRCQHRAPPLDHGSRWRKKPSWHMVSAPRCPHHFVFRFHQGVGV